MSGKDLHLPRLVAARMRSPSSSSRGSSSGRRGHTDRSASSTSSYSLPSSRTDPSDHSWDSPGWHPGRRPSATPMLLDLVESSPYSCWLSTSSSEKERRRSAAAATAAARMKNLERIRSLSEQRYDSLIAPPPRHSPEDYDRIYRMGIYKLKDIRVFHSAPDPYWCDDGYESSNSSENSADSPQLRPRFAKSEGGGASPNEPGFSIPFLDSDPMSNTQAGKGKRGRNIFQGRKLLLDDDPEGEDI